MHKLPASRKSGSIATLATLALISFLSVSVTPAYASTGDGSNSSAGATSVVSLKVATQGNPGKKVRMGPYADGMGCNFSRALDESRGKDIGNCFWYNGKTYYNVYVH